LRHFHIQLDMVWVYALKSERDGTLYVGISEDTERRLREHNSGKSSFTSGHRPWVLVYREAAPDWAAARKREKYLKGGAGKSWLRGEFRYIFLKKQSPASGTTANKQGLSCG
jgi:putative endonuclease